MAFADIVGALAAVHSTDGLRITGFFLIAGGVLQLYVRRPSNPRINQLKNVDPLRTDFMARYQRGVGNKIGGKQSLQVALVFIAVGIAFIFIN
jgi:hypothetical protein